MSEVSFPHRRFVVVNGEALLGALLESREAGWEAPHHADLLAEFGFSWAALPGNVLPIAGWICGEGPVCDLVLADDNGAALDLAMDALAGWCTENGIDLRSQGRPERKGSEHAV